MSLLRSAALLRKGGLSLVQLTESEHLVLTGPVDGVPTALLAARAHLSTNTIKTHRRTLYRKLKPTSRIEALVRATEYGLI